MAENALFHFVASLGIIATPRSIRKRTNFVHDLQGHEKTTCNPVVRLLMQLTCSAIVGRPLAKRAWLHRWKNSFLSNFEVIGNTGNISCFKAWFAGLVPAALTILAPSAFGSPTG